MNIKINRTYKKPTWESVLGQDKSKHSFANYESALNVKSMVVAGSIGWSGTKIHALHIHYVDTLDGIGIVSIFSTCGSAKWQSELRVSASDDMSLITCQKCK